MTTTIFINLSPSCQDRVPCDLCSPLGAKKFGACLSAFEPAKAT